ncbi:MAG: hypothetical protein K2G31_02875, partial [Clostridia bacterium]|nr:hypothetical protein [Clostridia bacterium]
LMKKGNITWILSIVLGLFCAIAMCGCDDTNVGVNNNSTLASQLTGRDKSCYDLVSSVVFEFKSPKSVRVVSGTIKSDNSACLRLTSTNSFGAVTSGYYFIFQADNGKTVLIDLEKTKEEYGNQTVTSETWEKYMATVENIELCKATNNFNADKINEALAEKFSNY